MNTGESDADARRFRSEQFRIQISSNTRNAPEKSVKFDRFLIFACFTLHSADRGTDQNIRIGSAINRLTEIRTTWENVLEKTSSLTQPLSSHVYSANIG